MATFLVLVCASCAERRESTSPHPSDVDSPSSSLTTPSIAPDLTGYAADEREAYDAAVRAYAKFTRVNARFLAEGRTTERASRFYHRYSIDWVEAWANLAQLANNRVTVRGDTTVLSVEPTSIELGAKESAVVVIRRCLDESHLKVVQEDRVLQQPQLKDPHVYRVRLIKKPDESWWRAGSAIQGAKC